MKKENEILYWNFLIRLFESDILKINKERLNIATKYNAGDNTTMSIMFSYGPFRQSFRTARGKNYWVTVLIHPKVISVGNFQVGKIGKNW